MPSSCRLWTTVTPFLPDRQGTLLTSCNVHWMLQHVSSWLHESSTTACHAYCVMSCTGLDIQKRVHYKLGVTVHRCLRNKAPKYLVDCCTPVSDIASRRHLSSASRPHLTVPRHRLSTFGRRAFFVSSDRFRQLCWRRTYFDVTTEYTQRSIEMLHDCALYKWLTLALTLTLFICTLS